jgi:ABC-type phosphate/phosphonate transport system ATPase subunit
MSDGTPFRFKRNAKVGEAAAEQDDEFLFNSFVDIGDFREIRDMQSPRRIVGRTGSGKSALLRYLAHDQEHVIEVDPEHLSLAYIANNDVIQFFEQLGLKLDLFYGLLWKHVLAVELIRHKYQLNTEEKTKSWVNQLVENFRRKDQTKERALEYLKKMGR